MSDLDFPLWSAIQGACSSLAPCTSAIRVLCQVLVPNAFLVHPVLAAVAEDAVAAQSSATDSAWKLAWTLQEVQARTTYHNLHLSCIYSLSFLLHCFFPSQEPSDRFLKRFSDDNKVISIEVLPVDPTVEFAWQGLKHNDEEKWAEYQALVNTDLYFKLFTVPLTNTNMALCIGIHPLHQLHNPLLHTEFSQCPPDDLPWHSLKLLLQV